MIEVEKATEIAEALGLRRKSAVKRRRKNGRSCEDCFFHRNMLCALDLDEPCSTFRPATTERPRTAAPAVAAGARDGTGRARRLAPIAPIKGSLALEWRRMSTERSSRLSASPPLFASRFLDFFSRIHPVVPALIYIPVIIGLVVVGARDDQGTLTIVALMAAGLFIWTLSEYWLHRKVFHWDPDHPIGHRLHFIIHGVHHDHPNDKMRLVMPPGARSRWHSCSSASSGSCSGRRRPTRCSPDF